MRTDQRNNRDFDPTIVQEEEKTNSSNLKSPVKRKSNCGSKENDKKRNKLMLDNVNDGKNNI